MRLIRLRSARALAPGGRLITLEAKPRYAKIALANIAHAGLRNRVDLRPGRALDSLPALSAEGPFDFVFIDADHENMPEYFQWALKFSRRGSLIVVDNVVRRGTVLHAGASKPEIQGIRRLAGTKRPEGRGYNEHHPVAPVSSPPMWATFQHAVNEHTFAYKNTAALVAEAFQAAVAKARELGWIV